MQYPFMTVPYAGSCCVLLKCMVHKIEQVHYSQQVKCFSEIINIGYAVYRVHNLPWFRSLSWYGFFKHSSFVSQHVSAKLGDNMELII